MLLFGQAKSHLPMAMRKWKSPQALILCDPDSLGFARKIQKQIPNSRFLDLKAKWSERDEIRLFKTVAQLPPESIIVSCGSGRVGRYAGFLSATLHGSFKWVHVPGDLSSSLEFRGQEVQFRYRNLPLRIRTRPSAIILEVRQIEKRLGRKPRALQPLRAFLKDGRDVGAPFTDIFREIASKGRTDIGGAACLGLEMSTRISHIQGHLSLRQFQAIMSVLAKTSVGNAGMEISYLDFLKRMGFRDGKVVVPLVRAGQAAQLKKVTRAEVILALIQTAQARKWKLV